MKVWIKSLSPLSSRILFYDDLDLKKYARV